MDLPTIEPTLIRNKRSPFGTSRTEWTHLAFLALPVFLFFTFYIYPIAATFYLSLQDRDGISQTMHYIGLQNYTALLVEPRFYRAVQNNLAWVIFMLVAPTGLGLLLAATLDRGLKFEGFFKVIFFLPFTIPAVAVAAIWRWVYEPTSGLLTAVHLLYVAEGHGEPVLMIRKQSFAPYAIAIAAAVVFLAPLVIAIMTSLKRPSEITSVLAVPRTLYFENFAIAFERMGRTFFNSIAITAPAVAFSVAVGAIAAYPLAYTRGRSGRFVYFFLLTGMLVPFQIVQIPLFIIIRSIGLYDSIAGMWLVHTAYAVPFCTFFMRNFFSLVPRSMYEAAQIEGCGAVGYFFRLLLPASGSGIAALAIIQSRYIWNDLLFAITLTSSDKARPVTVAISGFASSLQVEYGPLMAATLVSIIPVMLAYLLFQRAFVRGLLGSTGK